MSAQIFLTTDEILEILLAELPADVYASDYANDEDESRRSVSSSELRAHAELLSGLSENLESIYSDKFLQTVTEAGLILWEKDLFSTAQDSNLGFALRVQNLISKLRATGGISLPAITSIIAGILGGLDFEVLPYSGQAGVGAWVLDGSALDQGTWLAKIDPIMGARTEGGLIPLDCSFDYADEGLTAQDLLDIQETAYKYEVRIYGNASAATLSLLDQRLTQLEPARSTHVIRNNQISGPGVLANYIAATPDFQRFRL